MAGFKTRTGVGYSLPAVLAENIHYFTNTVQVPQQCNIFSAPSAPSNLGHVLNLLHCCGTSTVFVKQ
jgi:hypothetical protein